MAAASAAVEPLADGRPGQAPPRLTTMLRAFATAAGAPDVDALFLERQKALRRRQAGGQRSAREPAGLAARLLGARPPKAAREALERYQGAVAAALGAGVPFSEARAAAGALWDALAAAPQPPADARLSRAAQQAPLRRVAEGVLGVLQDAELQALLAAFQALQGWQARLGGPSQAPADRPAPEAWRFGSELPFRLAGGAAQQPLEFANGHRGAAAALDERAAGGQDAGVEAARQLYSAAMTDRQPGAAAAAAEAEEPPEGIEEEYLPGKRPAAPKVRAKWLLEWAAKAGGGPPAATAAARLLLEGASTDEAAAELFDLLGDAAFEPIQALLALRKPLAENLRAQIAAARAKGEGERAAMPTYGTTVSISRRSDKRARKQERRAGRAADADVAWLLQQQDDGLQALAEEEALKEAGGLVGGRLLIGDLEFAVGDGPAAKAALPAGTQRKSFKGYEEVSVPAIKASPPAAEEAPVLIAELPDWAQLAFQGYQSLNRIQSRIFPAAFRSNANLLVCAPTGAGKTNIAMIAVLHEVGANMRHGVVQKERFKVVYVAPMKALAAEMAATFGRRLAPLGLAVRELTGDMQLSKRELAETQMVVTTPEKWDVVTRKGGDAAVTSLVRLLIIDEVHLLNDERGPVIETLIARTQRQVEASQSMIRVVGLSATLPNHADVAAFLGVGQSGLFHFDASYRPVPLAMQFVGVSERSVPAARALQDDICFDKVLESLKQGHQAMVFVHSRKDTGKTGRTLVAKLQAAGAAAHFDCQAQPGWAGFAREVGKSRNRELQELWPHGVGLHHAGMLRGDRALTERAFAGGCLRVLCCTATLAWGVNLPAHTVIIKGTQLYDPQRGAFVQLGMLDVQQIFGRAGRPQYEDSGLGVIITQHASLARYLGLLTHQTPIESQFVAKIVDNLNAEIVLGTVTNIKEAVAWLGYTYLFVRMRRNPLAYGVAWEQLAADPELLAARRALATAAARQLEACRMARWDERSGNLYVTDLGRVASHFYVGHSTIVVFNSHLRPAMSEAEVLSMLAQASEFENMQVREEEMPELDALAADACPLDVKGGAANKHGKVAILLQAYISRARVESFSLVADLNYVAQNAPRIARALFEICLRRGWPGLAAQVLTLAKAFERRLWPHQSLLRQFEGALSPGVLSKLEDSGLSAERLADMPAGEIGALLRQPGAGGAVRACLDALPALRLEAQLQPITRSVLRVQLRIEPAFEWRAGAHGGALRWHVWVEDGANEHVYHSELWTLTQKGAREECQRLAFAIPIFEPLPTQYFIRVVSDSWLGAEAVLPLSFRGLILPEVHPPHTELLDLDPLPRSALGNPEFEALYRFSHFNPIQTQAFHTLYHTDENVLLGAPTGSGKTVSAELTMLRLFRAHPGFKVIYIAPLKALVRERIREWGAGLCAALGKSLVELTGDVTPDARALLGADVIVATPEKWDGISRAWASRAYVQRVGLLVIDEIHLLGADRGPILEVIVSRLRYVASQTGRHVRFVGLSTALANAADLADWLAIGRKGLFNFKPSVRPVPLDCHIQGYPGKHYCPRMAAMNKPAYAAIRTHAPTKPVLVFVSSRRQTRLTALDLIAFAAADDAPQQFVHMPEAELEAIVATLKDASLRDTLRFGIGLHHAGLAEGDRAAVEALFVGGRIQVLVATSTLAWGVNTPAHLVIIKGTEFFDAGAGRYVDFPITDVLQMMGRAGRPQFDSHGVAVVMVAEPKKSFYRKFLYEPFPVESSLHAQLADHLNAEVVAGTVGSAQDAVDYLTWTFFFRRLLLNPTYYDAPGAAPEEVSVHLSRLVQATLAQLEAAGCVWLEEDGRVEAAALGRIASFYYLKHQTMAVFADGLHPAMRVPEVLELLCCAEEFAEMPVRHNEDRLNAGLAAAARFPVDSRALDEPGVKSNLLLQAHVGRLPLPVSDYATDTKAALDNSQRLLHALVDAAADAGLLSSALAAMALVQSLTQALWLDEPSVRMLPGVEPQHVAPLAAARLAELPQLAQAARTQPGATAQLLARVLGSDTAARACLQVCARLPLVEVSWQPPQPAGDGCEVRVSLRRLGGGRGQRVFAPRFPKVRDEGWWLVLGDAATDELHALKRLSFGQRTSAVLSAQLPPDAAARELSLFLVCDAYLGLDQQYRLNQAPARAVDDMGAQRAAEQLGGLALAEGGTEAGGRPQGRRRYAR